MHPDANPIVIAYDGSETARAAIAEAAVLFPDRHALVVTVWRSIAPAMPASLIAMPAGLAREAQAALDAGYEAEATDLANEGVELAHERGLDAEPVAVASTSAVWLTIIDTADEHDATAVVVGSRGRSTMRSAFLGSVSNGPGPSLPPPGCRRATGNH